MTAAGAPPRAIGHDEALDLAAAALDAPLLNGDEVALEAHLVTCSTCSQARRAMQADAEALGGLPRHDAPEHIRRVVVTSLVSPTPAWRRWLPQVSLAGLGVLVAGALAAVATTTPPTTGLTSKPLAYVWNLETPASGMGSSQDLTALASDGTTVVALGTGPAGVMAWRSDGSGWSAVPASPFAGAQVTAATRSSAGFVAVGYAVGRDGGSRAVSWTSTDGSTWRRSPAEPILERAAMADVVPAGSGLLAVGLSDQPEEAAVWRSDDGLHWTALPWPGDGAGARMNGIARLGGTYVAVGQDAAGAAIWWSSDGQAFHRLDLQAGDGTRLLGVTAGGPGFVAVGSTVDASRVQHPAVWTSTDGLVWQAQTDAITDQGVQLSCVAAGLGRLTAVGRSPGGAVAYVSLDGSAWQALPAGPGFDGASFDAVLADGGRLLVAGRGPRGPGIWQLRRPDGPGGPLPAW